MPTDDPLAPVWEGDAAPNSARMWNRLIEAGRAQQRGQLGTAAPPGVPELLADPAALVFVRATAAPLAPFTVSRYGAVPLDVARAPGEARRRPVFEFAAPGADTDPVAITVDGVGRGALARAACSGVALCRLDLVSATHAFARPIAGDSTRLRSSATSGYPLLWFETPAGSGSGSGSGSGGSTEVWAYVLLGGGGAGGADDENGGGGASGDSCAWLADLPLDDEEIRPDMLIQLRGGSGRCGCIRTEGATDAEEGTRAFWDAEIEAWRSYKGVRLCCGCADATFAVNPGALTATLTLNNFRSCQDAGGGSEGSGGSGSGGACAPPVSISLTKDRCGTDRSGRPFVEFFGYGPDPCSGDRGRCDNTFRVRVVCVPREDCDAGGAAECPSCVEGQRGPGAYTVDTPTGWAGCCAAYAGRWRLLPDGPCTWKAECGEITVTLAVVSCLKMRLTFAGAACGAVVYEYTSTDPTALVCRDNKTLTRVSGSEDSPATVQANPASCDTGCPNLTVSSSGILPCSTGCGAAGTVWTDLPMSLFAGLYQAATVGGGSLTPDCECDGVAQGKTCKGFGVIVRCLAGGRRFVVERYCASAVGCEVLIACYAGPAESIEVENEIDPSLGALFSVTFAVADPACAEGSIEVTLTFSGAP